MKWIQIYHSNSCLVLKDLDKSCLYGMINRLLERERERERERESGDEVIYQLNLVLIFKRITFN